MHIVMTIAQIKIIAGVYSVVLTFEEAAELRDFLVKTLPPKPEKKKRK